MATETVYASDSGWLRSQYPTTVYHVSPNHIRTTNYCNSDPSMVTIITFSLSAIPTGSTITNAVLKLKWE